MLCEVGRVWYLHTLHSYWERTMVSFPRQDPAPALYMHQSTTSAIFVMSQFRDELIWTIILDLHALCGHEIAGVSQHSPSLNIHSTWELQNAVQEDVASRLEQKGKNGWANIADGRLMQTDKSSYLELENSILSPESCNILRCKMGCLPQACNEPQWLQGRSQIDGPVWDGE